MGDVYKAYRAFVASDVLVLFFKHGLPQYIFLTGLGLAETACLCPSAGIKTLCSHLLGFSLAVCSVW